MWTRYRATVPVHTLQEIDRLMHIHHNNGSIFNKPHLLKRGVRLTQADLDVRAALKSPEEFLPHVSQYVANLIRSAA